MLNNDKYKQIIKVISKYYSLRYVLTEQTVNPYENIRMSVQTLFGSQTLFSSQYLVRPNYSDVHDISNDIPDMIFLVTQTPDENWRVIPYLRKHSFLVQTDTLEKEDVD